jgi:hypothetical protein
VPVKVAAFNAFADRGHSHGRRRLDEQPPRPGVRPTIVLEHGAWADGSSWNGVVTRLQQDGYTVDVPPNPLRGPDSDSAYLASYLATVPGPVVLVGQRPTTRSRPPRRSSWPPARTPR